LPPPSFMLAIIFTTKAKHNTHIVILTCRRNRPENQVCFFVSIFYRHTPFPNL